jgi:hypothetical protein
MSKTKTPQRGTDPQEQEPGLVHLELTDSQFDDFKARINGAIHELVFLTEFMDNGDAERAQDCLVTINLNLNALAEEYEALRKGPR